jgi:DNA-binding MarR family transcriptional regulator
MSNPDRPQAPGYLANLMARLFHDVSGIGLRPLGIRPEHFPILVELWFGDGEVTRETLCRTQEAEQGWIDALVRELAEAGLIEPIADAPAATLILTQKARAARDAAMPAARRANDAVRSSLSEDELAQLMSLMNRVIDALQAAKG